MKNPFEIPEEGGKTEKKPKKDTTRAEDERKENDLHFSSLYDLDETVTGEKIDPTTGEPYDNSPPVTSEDEILTEFDSPDQGESEDIMGRLREEKDEASLWLKKHDKSNKRKNS